MDSAPIPSPAAPADPSADPSATPPPAAPHKHPPYVAVWFGLAALTAVELGVAFLPWPKLTLILLLIGLAVWKALLVALYYMHLRWERGRLRILALAPLPFCVILVTAVLQERFR